MENRNGMGTAEERGVLRFQLPICDRTVTNEVSEEVSLPDYQPEIKRLLRVSATVQPANRYVGGGAVEFSGTVDYCILYAGNDGQMYCFPTTSDYSFRVPLEAETAFDLNDGLVAYVESEPESVITRVGGPRRMSVKCRLRSRVCVYGSFVAEEKRRDGESAAREERLLRESEGAVCAYGISEPQTVQDEILLEHEDGAPDAWRIISGEAQVQINEAMCGNGRVNCRGDVVVKLLMQKEATLEEAAALPTTVLRKLPFSGEIPMDGAAINGEAVATGSCTRLDLTLEEGRVLCDAEIVLEARSQRQDRVPYTADWYAQGHESDCTMVEYALPSAVRCVNGNLTQSEARPLEEVGIPASARPVDTAGSATVEGVEIAKNRVVVTGKCRYSMILADGGDMSAKEVDMPFRYTADGVFHTDGPLSYEAQAQVMTARARMDGERLAVDAELTIALRLWEVRPVQMVGEVHVGEEVRVPSGQVRLCYPAADETLWDVAKQYHVSTASLMEKNHLDGAGRADDGKSLTGVSVLVL